MAMSDPVRVMLAEMRSSAMQRSKRPTGSSDVVIPFITISRMSGAGAHTLASNLADRLSRGQPDTDRWHSFDRELVDLIAADHQISQSLIDTLEDTGRSWLDSVLSGLKFSGNTPSELELYRKVAQSVLALAKAGKTILVGRGGVFITQDVPGGIHLLVTAPVEVRAERTAEMRDISLNEATRLIRDIDQNRADFYQRHWPGRPYGPESFMLTLNSAMLSEQQMVDTIVPLVPSG